MSELAIDLYDAAARARVEALQWRLALDLLRFGQEVLLENGFWSREERDRLRTEARSLGSAVELRFLDVPFELLWARLQRRNAERPPHTALITREQLRQYESLFEAPDAAELALYDPPAC